MKTGKYINGTWQHFLLGVVCSAVSLLLFGGLGQGIIAMAAFEAGQIDVLLSEGYNLKSIIIDTIHDLFMDGLGVVFIVLLGLLI